MGFDQFLTNPKKKEAAALQTQVQEINEKVASVTVSMAGLNQIKKRVEEKRREKEALSGKIPDDRQIGLIMDQLGKESQTKQIDLIQFLINEGAGGQAEDKLKAKSGPFKRVLLEVGLNAVFGTIGPCLENIQSLPVFSEIQKIDIRRVEKTFPKFKVTVEEVLFISPSARKEPPGKGGAENFQTSR
jgi:hypothetical protein